LPLSERLRRLAGTTPGARRLTIGTVVAIAIAVVAFIVLPASDGGQKVPPRDAYTVSADQVCVAEKQQIAAAARRALAGSARTNPDRYASALVPIIEEWRLALATTPPPADRRDLVSALDSALRETMSQAGTLARLSRGGDRKQILAQATEVDAASSGVEEAIAALGLQRCANLGVGVGHLISR